MRAQKEGLQAELAEVNESTEGGVTNTNAEMLKDLQDSFDGLTEMDAASDAAVASAKAAEESVDEVDKDLKAAF